MKGKRGYHMRLGLLPTASAVKLLVAIGLTSPIWLISAYAQNGTNVTHHRTVPTVKIVHTATAMVAPTPAAYAASQGRGAPTEDAFSRNPEDCNHALCIGQ
jgi:hypothetical protein